MTQKIIYCLLLLLCTGKILAQNICTNPGQTPLTAIPVCGNNPIHQSPLPSCRNSSIFVPGCSNQNTSYNDNNPFYYKFTCYTAGTLGFVITPDSITDDNDWQLYDITGHNPNDIFSFTDNTLLVTGNWSGNQGLTGASANGINFIQCRSDPFYIQTSTFTTMPQLIRQHEYLLLVAHNDSLQGGFTLSFGGGTADITDRVLPSITTVNSTCNRNELLVKLNKKIKCSSIATDGSDFSLLPSGAAIISAAGIQCSNNSETDSILLTFNNNVPAGNYSLVADKGSDGNTLMDYCGNSITAGSRLVFSLAAFAPVDSITPPSCSPAKLTVVFRKNIQCSSIAADGSDFIITGASPVTIIRASGTCTASDNTSGIELTLSKPVTQSGNYIVTIKNGSDGNSLIDQCGTATPAGTEISFSIKDTVNAGFLFTIHTGCTNDTVNFVHDGNNQVNSWLWSFGNGSSQVQNPSAIYNTPGNKQVQLIVSNGMCSDTATAGFVLNEKLNADFTGPGIICPEETAIFKNNSNNATGWLWNFSNGNTSTLQNPAPQRFPSSATEQTYTVSLTADDGTCTSTVSHLIKVVTSCYVAVPTAFTPNNDNLNDFLYPLNIFQTDHFEFKVYNRMGQLVFTSTDSQKKWDGTFKGSRQPAATYVWLLTYTQRSTGKEISMKGTTLLIR